MSCTFCVNNSNKKNEKKMNHANVEYRNSLLYTLDRSHIIHRKSERKTKFLRSTYTFSELLMTAMIWIRYVWAHLSEWASKHVSFHFTLTLSLSISLHLAPLFIHSLPLSHSTMHKIYHFLFGWKTFHLIFRATKLWNRLHKRNHCT